MTLRIGMTFAPEQTSGVNNYREALLHFGQETGHEVEVVDLWRSPDLIDTIDGILFTGGDDIDPTRYGEADPAKQCAPVDRERDALEFSLATKAEALGLPTLGICRGCQLLNVHRGGSLITDIVSRGGRDHTKHDGVDGRHAVEVSPGSFLRKVIGLGQGEINSSHHQAVDRLGDGLAATARSAGVLTYLPVTLTLRPICAGAIAPVGEITESSGKTVSSTLGGFFISSARFHCQFANDKKIATSRAVASHCHIFRIWILLFTENRGQSLYVHY